MQEEFLIEARRDRVVRIPLLVWQRLGLKPNQVVRVTIRVEEE